MKRCTHSPWDGYGLCILSSRLAWIKAENPSLYKLYDENGKWTMVNGARNQELIARYKSKGLRVELCDNQEEIRELERSIASVEKRLEEHRRECLNK